MNSLSEYQASLVSADTYSLQIGSFLVDNPQYFDGPHGDGCTLDESELYSVYNKYKSSAFPDGVSIKRSVYFPPNEKFYVVGYSLDEGSSDVTIFDYIISGTSGSNNCAHTWEEDGIMYLDQTGCGGGVLATGRLGGLITEFSVGDSARPLDIFVKNKGKLDQQSDWVATTIAAGSLSHLSSDQRTAYYFRVGAEDVDSARALAKATMGLSPDTVISSTKSAYKKWLDKAIMPDISGSTASLYRNSLIGLKSAQNPTLGAIVASGHPDYGYKVWSRDSVFAGLILDAAGYHDEAELFLKWISSAELTSGHFHTCYDWFTGKPAPFVEPQIDGTGLYLFSLLYHASLTGLDFISNVQNQKDNIESFFLNTVGQYNLAPPDYSIWEESSDGHSGQSLPTQYFTFTQALSWSGIQAASLLESYLGNQDRANQLQSRADELGKAIKTYLWSGKYYYRGLWSDTLKPDTRIDASTAAVVFTGLDTTHTTHMDMIRKNLTHLDSGIARYEGDFFFYSSIYNPCSEREVGATEPPWGVTTCFTALAEIEESSNSGPQIESRIKWMEQTSAFGDNPVGECIDGVKGIFVHDSAPDFYEHGGVFIFTELVYNNLAPGLNPFKVPKPS